QMTLGGPDLLVVRLESPTYLLSGWKARPTSWPGLPSGRQAQYTRSSFSVRIQLDPPGHGSVFIYGIRPVDLTRGFSNAFRVHWPRDDDAGGLGDRRGRRSRDDVRPHHRRVRPQCVSAHLARLAAEMRIGRRGSGVVK